MMVIDKTTYKLTDSNYFKTEYTKKQIVVGHTGRTGMTHYSTWKNRLSGNYKKCATYTIDNDGNIFEHFNPKYYSHFIDKYDMSPFTIGITLTNVGWLERDNLKNRYVDWLGHEYNLPDEDVVFERWRNKQYWLKYGDNQLKSLKNLTDHLCKKFKIKNDCISHTVFNEDVDIYEGIVFRSNYYQELTDISPAFDMGIFTS